MRGSPCPPHWSVATWHQEGREQHLRSQGNWAGDPCSGDWGGGCGSTVCRMVGDAHQFMSYSSIISVLHFKIRMTKAIYHEYQRMFHNVPIFETVRTKLARTPWLCCQHFKIFSHDNCKRTVHGCGSVPRNQEANPIYLSKTPPHHMLLKHADVFRKPPTLARFCSEMWESP